MKTQVLAVGGQAGLAEIVRRPEGVWVEHSLLDERHFVRCWALIILFNSRNEPGR